MGPYFIELRDEKSQEGWFTCVGGEGELFVTHDPSAAAQYATEDDADAAVKWLASTCGLNVEEAMVRQLAVPDVFQLRLGGEHADDGIAVVREGNNRFITIRNAGFASSEEIPDEVAELLIRVLDKIDRRLGKR